MKSSNEIFFVAQKKSSCSPPTAWINFYGDEFRLKFDSRRHLRVENREASAVLRNQLSLAKNASNFHSMPMSPEFRLLHPTSSVRKLHKRKLLTSREQLVNGKVEMSSNVMKSGWLNSRQTIQLPRNGSRNLTANCPGLDLSQQKSQPATKVAQKNIVDRVCYCITVLRPAPSVENCETSRVHLN